MLQIQNILSYLNKILSDNVTIEDHSDLLLKMSSDANNYIKSSAFFNNKVQKCFIHHICNNIGCGSQKIRACNNIRSTDILNEIISNDNTMLDVLVFSWDSKTSLIEDKTVFIKYQDLLKHASWSGSRDEIKNAYNLSKISFYSLKTDLFKKRHIEHLLLELLKKSSMQNLFKSHKETYGISYLLYALVELCRVDLYNDFANHLKEISELLLRNMEIKRETTVNYKNNDYGYKLLIIDQLRTNAALVEVSILFNDLRFLNAVMKSNDRLYKSIKKNKMLLNNRKINTKNLLLLFHYKRVIDMQERHYNSILCQI